jgi:hypothetical protein
MRITAQLSVIAAAIFAIICFGVAINGFMSMGEIKDPAQLADARGFALFWAFLGTLGVVFGGVGVWIVKTHQE